MANNQLKCGIIYKKIAIQAGDDEQVIMNGHILVLITWKHPMQGSSFPYETFFK